MAEHYRYGIDLGTTNSVIARFDEGAVQLFSNPGDSGRNVLPSAIGWRDSRVIVGSKAREFAMRPESRGNFHTAFKRRMGTAESFRISSADVTVTPVELSAEVLKELRRFVTDDGNFEHAVVTIPASFNQQQANATTEAARLAGIRHVALLQEPIAASLAYANDSGKECESGKWLVYDLGGGTFDVALVEIIEDQLRVVDHEGDNYLGGRDFDAMIIDEVVLPHLSRSYAFDDLEKDLKDASGRFNHIYQRLLMLAEAAKVELSARDSAELDLDLQGVEDTNGKEVISTVTLTRGDLEKLIRPSIDRTVELTRELLTRNKLRGSDLSFILLVGGSTFIPCVRHVVGQSLEVPVRSDIDPTTAIAIGAAYYASSKTVPQDVDDGRSEATPGTVKLKAAYQRSSKDVEEYYAARVDNWRSGLRYRIVRRDGGYDTHWKDLGERIAEDLPLREGEYNHFVVEITDEQGRPVTVENHEIAIAHGKVHTGGQPLPEDVSIEKDMVGEERTGLVPLFRRNTVLPARTQCTYTVNRTVVKGSSEDPLRVRVLEGPGDCMPAACLCIGELLIRGSDLHDTLYKGADIEIEVRMDENRDLHVEVELPSIDQRFAQVYRGGYREVHLGYVREEVEHLADEVDQDIQEAEEAENYERARRLKGLQQRTDELHEKLCTLRDEDATDTRYQYENEKQRLAAEVSRVTADRDLRAAREEYARMMSATADSVAQYGSDEDRQRLTELQANEHAIDSSNDRQRVEAEINRVAAVYWNIQMRRPEVLQGWFNQLCGQASSMNQSARAEALIKEGQSACDSADWARLREINRSLLMLLPSGDQTALQEKTGIGFC